MGRGFLLGYLGHLVAPTTRYVLILRSFNLLFRTHYLFEAVLHIIDVLGKLPPRFDLGQPNLWGSLDEYAPTIPTGFFPSDVKAKDIDIELISLPSANTEVSDS